MVCAVGLSPHSGLWFARSLPGVRFASPPATRCRPFGTGRTPESPDTTNRTLNNRFQNNAFLKQPDLSIFPPRLCVSASRAPRSRQMKRPGHPWGDGRANGRTGQVVSAVTRVRRRRVRPGRRWQRCGCCRSGRWSRRRSSTDRCRAGSPSWPRRRRADRCQERLPARRGSR